jgi:hypothetical protein
MIIKKYFFLLLFLIFISQAAFMSGSVDLISLEESFSENNAVYIITITGSFLAKINEINMVEPSVSQKVVYKAVVSQIYHQPSVSITNMTENEWHITLPSSEKESLKKIKKKKKLYPEINDEIYIMDSEDIYYSIVYHVKGLHKIFIYHQCGDSAKEIKTGEKYFFIRGSQSVNKNYVLYGNIDFGIFNYTNDIENRIKSIISR